MRLLEQLFGIYSPSGHEERMKKFLRRWMKSNIPGCKVWKDTKGNMYVKKGKSDSYPCVVAHLDQVQKTHSVDFRTIGTKEGVIFGYSPRNRHYEGLGADDKCGIWIALKCLEKYETIKLCFFVEEETGCRGSSECDMHFFEDVRFVLEPDRRGKDDLITSIGWSDLCTEDFIKAVEPERYGYHIEQGMMTDIEALKENGLAVCCVNISCGYYNPHTDEEFVVRQDLMNCLAFVEHIIEKVKEPMPHIFEDFYYGQDEATDELYDIVDNQLSNWPETTAEELMGYYHDYFPNLKLQDYEKAIQEWHDYNDPSFPECFGTHIETQPLTPRHYGQEKRN